MKRRLAQLLAVVFVALITAIPRPAQSDGPIGGRILIQNQAGIFESRPSVAYNSQMDEYLVVWASNTGIQGKRVDADGGVHGTPFGSPFQISSSSSTSPDVAYNSVDNEYIVVWQTNLDVCGRILSATGAPLTGVFTIAHGIYIAPESGASYGDPSVAYSSTANRYLAVYHYSFYNWLDSGDSIEARSYDANGSPEDAQFRVGEFSMDYRLQSPDVAYNHSRNEFLVVWQMHAGGDFDVYGRRVEMTGATDVLGLEFPIADHIPENEMNPAVGAIPTVPGEGRYQVAWERNNNIYATIVTGTGGVGAWQTLADSSLGEYDPAVAGNEINDQFLVTWTAVIEPLAPVVEVQGRKMDINGALLRTKKSVSGHAVDNSDLAAGALGDFLIVFEDTEVPGLPENGIYGSLWGDRIYLPLILR
jgi:hypothetical protein